MCEYVAVCGSSDAESRQFVAAIAAETALKQKDVKNVMDAIIEAVVREVRKNGVFKIPRIAAIKMTTNRAREAGTRKMFGKEVHVVARPTTTKMKAYVSKQLRDAIR